MNPENNPVPPHIITSLDPLPEDSEPKPRHEGLLSVLSTVAILIAAPIVAILLTTFVFQSYEVDGPSMETTLQNRDRLIVMKLPRTIARVTGNDYIPKRGDVVVFVERGFDDFSDGEKDKQLIKRVIALPGERIVIKDGIVTVYNKQNPSGFQPDLLSPYGKVIETTTTDTDEVVPEGKVFVMGDNRQNSLDSRAFGPVASEDLVGKLVLRIFPLSGAKLF